MGRTLCHYRVLEKIGAGAWARCIAPATRSWGGTWR